MKKMQGDNGWRKKATHSYVELSYKKKELLAKNHVRIRLPARAYAAICSIDTSRPYSSDSGRVAFSPELRVGTGSDNFFTFRT